MIERNAMQANMLANAVEVLENLRLDVCRNMKYCDDCPLGRLYNTLEHNFCKDLEHTAGRLMLARRVVETL